jgi:tetratricopeptide (TPR) repeat protein
MCPPIHTINVTHSKKANKHTKRLFVLLCLLLFGLMIALVPDYASSGDEVFQWLYGQMVYDYYATAGHNRAALESQISNIWMLRNYGGLFDGFTTILTGVFHPKDEFLLRHYVNVLFSFPAFVFAGLLAREVSGRWSTAVAAVLLLIATPRFWGECFNNSKDIPFAMSALFFSWALIRWMKRVEQLTWRDTAIVGISVMLGISTRPGGVLFLGYFLLFAFIALYQSACAIAHWKKAARHVCVACVIGYFGGCIFWPYALENPILHPFRALKLMAKYPAWSHLLFEGQYEFIPYLPRHYGVKMLLITMPVIMFAGSILAIVLMSTGGRCSSLRRYLPVLLFMIFFPFLFMLARGSILYDGVRHLLFVIGLVTVVTAIGLEALLYRLRETPLMLIPALGAIVLLVVHPLRFMVRNHPYEYVYFNETVGGIRGAYTWYETDYYMHSVKEAYSWLLQHEAKAISSTRDSLTLATDCFAQIHYNYIRANPARLKVIEESFATQNRSDWDYAIFISRFLDGPSLRSGYWPAHAKVIYTVKAEGVPLCVVLKNDTAHLGYNAWKAQGKGDYTTAVSYGMRAAVQYPTDLEIWSNLARACLALNQLDSAKWASDHALALSGDNNVSVYYAGEIAFRRGDIKNAYAIYRRFLKRYKTLPMTWLGMAQAQVLMGDVDGAERSFWQGVRINMGDRYRMYKVLAAIAQKKGYAAQHAFFEQLAVRNYNP